MDGLKSYFSATSILTEDTWRDILPLFKEEFLSKNEYYIRENETARKIGFLLSGVVRAFFINNEGKEYNKQFFVGKNIIGAYSSLLTSQANIIAQQALTECFIYSCDYKTLIDLFDKHPDLERLLNNILLKKKKRK